MSPQGRRDFGAAIDARSDGPATEGDSGRVSLWNAATLKPIQEWNAHNQQVTTVAFTPDSKFLASSGIDERVRNSAIDLARLSHEVADLRDRVSRLEGMLAAGLALSRDAGPRRDRRRLPGVADQTG